MSLSSISPLFPKSLHTFVMCFSCCLCWTLFVCENKLIKLNQREGDWLSHLEEKKVVCDNKLKTFSGNCTSINSYLNFSIKIDSAIWYHTFSFRKDKYFSLWTVWNWKHSLVAPAKIAVGCCAIPVMNNMCLHLEKYTVITASIKHYRQRDGLFSLIAT